MRIGIVDEGRNIVRPLPRLVLARELLHDDDEPPEPHAKVHNSEKMNSQVGLRRRLCEKSDSGRIMLHVSMIHAAHHH